MPSGVNTYGSMLHVAAVTEYVNPPTEATVTDVFSNKWRMLGRRKDNASGCSISLWYCENPTNSALGASTHTLTVSGSGIYPTVAFYSFSGTDPAAPLCETELLGQSASGTSATFSYTPGIGGLIIAAGVLGVSSGLPVVTGLLSPLSALDVTNVPIWAGYQIQSSPSALSIGVSWPSASTTTGMAALFRLPVSGGGGFGPIGEGLVY